MGKAIVIPGISFAGLGMGKVHYPSSVISITAPNIAVGSSCQLDCSVESATWSVNSETYATINSSGLLTIKSGAYGNDVVVTATHPTDETQVATKTIKLFYSSISSGEFEELTTIDLSNNIGNGSWGNPQNAQRVCSNSSIGINGYRYCMVNTTKPNVSGYAFYISVQLGTYSAGTQRGTYSDTLNPYHICEMPGSGDLRAMQSLLPLFEDTTFPGYTAGQSSGSTPVSYGITFDESNNGLYSGGRVLRAADFSGYTTTVIMFK